MDADKATIAQLQENAKRVDATKDDRLEGLKQQLVRDQEMRLTRDQNAIDNFDKRIAREKANLGQRQANAELRLRADEEALLELTRVEAERGASAQAVQLGVFPARD